MNNHSLRTIGILAIVFVIAGLQAIKGSVGGDFTLVLAVLGFVEHALAGNTTT